MNWLRAIQYAVIGALVGACIGAGLAIYTDESWLSPDIQSLLVQGRVRSTSPNGGIERRQSEVSTSSSGAQEPD